MQNYNQQQQAVILKGIANQILSMNMPSFEVVSKLFNNFDIDMNGGVTYTQMYRALGAALALNDDIKGDREKTQHTLAHYAMQEENDSEWKIRNAFLNSL